jgi:hypothetical protein
MISKLIANALVVFGIAGPLIALLDWLLSPRSKALLEERALRYWSWLAEHKGIEALQWLRNQHLQNILYFVHIVPSAYFTVRVLPDPTSTSAGFAVLGIALGGLHAYRAMASWLGQAPSLQNYALRTVGVLGCLSAILVPAIVAAVHLPEHTGLLVVANLVVVLAGSFFGTLLDVSVISVLLLSGLLNAFLRGLEYLLRRALEQGKGVLAGVGGLVTVLGLLLKALL